MGGGGGGLRKLGGGFSHGVLGEEVAIRDLVSIENQIQLCGLFL